MKGLSDDVDFQNLTVFPACIPRSELGIQNIFSRIIVVETRFLKRRRAFRFVVLRRKMKNVFAFSSVFNFASHRNVFVFKTINNHLKY